MASSLDVIFGKANPEGKLPFELPASMEAVRRQKVKAIADGDEVMLQEPYDGFEC
jgi:hypothetical protein